MATLAEVLITAGFAFLLGLMAGACIGFLQSEQEAIVRCKDCKHNPEETWFGCPMAGTRRRTDDTFCSFGERKEE